MNKTTINTLYTKAYNERQDAARYNAAAARITATGPVAARCKATLHRIADTCTHNASLYLTRAREWSH